MKKLLFFLLAGSLLVMQSCTQQGREEPLDQVSDEALALMTNAGFDVSNIPPIHFENGYLIEGDIYLTEQQLRESPAGYTLDIPTEEQYHTNNLVSVSGSRVINVYISAADLASNNTVSKAKGGKPGGGGGGGGDTSADFPAEYGAALNEAIARYNAENLTITLQRVTNSNSADIVFTRLGKRDERRGVLGSAGFPTSSGDPYGQVRMSGIIQSTYGWSTNAIATVMAHELGHCVGFRHTDYFDRSISCGGGTSNEGDGGVGANHIPGTPTGATRAAASFMLACSDGSDRPFNNDDKTALDYLY